MFTIFLVGIPVILVNMLLQSLVSVWCIRFYVKRFHRREGALAGMLALFGIITLVMLGNLAQIGVWGGGSSSGWGSSTPCWRPSTTPVSISPPWAMATSS
ncbi:hypothetical protein ACV1C6_02460 [Aeromonas sanarellii]